MKKPVVVERLGGNYVLVRHPMVIDRNDPKHEHHMEEPQLAQENEDGTFSYVNAKTLKLRNLPSRVVQYIKRMRSPRTHSMTDSREKTSMHHDSDVARHVNHMATRFHAQASEPEDM